MKLYNRTLDHINLKVPNLEQAVKYYTEVLGFKEICESDIYLYYCK